MLLKLLVTLIMLVGLGFTLVPRVPGTLVILLGAVIYGVFTGFATFTPWLWLWLVSLVAVAEIGGRVLRVALTRRFSLTREFSANSTVGNIAGMLAADALLGPVLGLIVWELVAGKTLEPRWNTVGRILLRLAAAAALRFVCGLALLGLILYYVFA